MNGLAYIRTLADEPDGADFTALADDIKEIHRTTQGNGYSYTTWQARQVRGDEVTYPSDQDCQPIGGRFFDGNLTAPLGGIAAVEFLPHQCALVTTLRTGNIGRRKRGRFFAAGFGESQQEAGVFSPAVVTAISDAWVTFLAEYAIPTPTSGFRLGVWSVREATGCGIDEDTHEHGRLDPPHPELAFTAVNAHITRSPVFTQRRRRIGVGM
jgi:hypothetical protein